MVGKLLSNVEILAVKDSNGKNVFENSAETRTPAYLYFGFEQNIFILMKKASYLNDVELFPVPMGQTVEEENATRVSTQYLKDYIDARTLTISEDEIISEATNNTNTSDNTNSGTTN